MTDRKITSEWVYLLVSLIFGLFALPITAAVLFANAVDLTMFYVGVLGGEFAALSWGLALTPYIIFQVLRIMQKVIVDEPELDIEEPTTTSGPTIIEVPPATPTAHSLGI